MQKIQNIITVYSGKGGVGKSTVAFSLAKALKDLNLSVGILDADIHGPSLPILMDEKGPPQMKEGQFLPFEKDGLRGMSIGFLVNTQQALAWRGPMVQKAIRQLFHDVRWDAPDILIVDMPPGTGDIQITINRLVNIRGSILVTTPDPLALEDLHRSIDLLQKLNTPLLGLIENMGHILCPNCDHHISFSDPELDKLKNHIPLLGSIPFDFRFRTHRSDNFPQKQAFEKIAEKLWQSLNS